MSNIGNYTPEDLRDPISAITQLIRNHDLNFECVLPAVVLSYDRVSNIVTIQGAINHIDTDGNSIERVAMKVPCFNPCGNGIGLNFPLKQGDTGWVIASDRDTDLFFKTLKREDPNTGKIHAFDFGYFVPDKISGFQINAEDEDALVIQTLDNSSRISIKDGRIKITKDDVSATFNGVAIDLVTPTAKINITDDGTVVIKATNVTVDGMLGSTLGASGIIASTAIATVTNGIVTSIS